MSGEMFLDKTVVVLGGGIAGLESALRLERKGFKVKMVDPEDALLFYPSSYSILEGGNPEKISIDYSRKFDGRNIEHIEDRVRGLEKSERKVLLDEKELGYDYAVFCLGAEDNYHGIDAEALTMRSVDDIKEGKEKIEDGKVENAVIVGGGSTGVGICAALSELREKTDQEFNITLLQDIDRLVRNLSEKTADQALERLESMDVEVKFNEAVKSLEEGIETEDSVYDSDLNFWAAGIKKKSMLENLDLEQDGRGLKVDKFNRVRGEKKVFAAGDNCSYEGKKTRATFALFEAKTVAKNILRAEEGKELKSRTISYDATLLYLGKHFSILEIGGFNLKGFLPSLMEAIGVTKRYIWLRKYLL